MKRYNTSVFGPIYEKTPIFLSYLRFLAKNSDSEPEQKNSWSNAANSTNSMFRGKNEENSSHNILPQQTSIAVPARRSHVNYAS